mgnify:CR=1 FL=1
MIDHEKVEQAVRLLLEGIGEDVNREGLIDTPDRIARMYEEIYGGMEEDAATHLSKTFTVDSSEMVVEKDITFYSTCEHHLLPFYGKVHIGYIPDGKVVGLSKLARTVEVFARRLQLQEQLTGQIADALFNGGGLGAHFLLHFLCHLDLLVHIDDAAPADLVHPGQGGVEADGFIQDQSVGLAVLGDVGQAVMNGLLRSAQIDLFSVDVDLAGDA